MFVCAVTSAIGACLLGWLMFECSVFLDDFGTLVPLMFFSVNVANMFVSGLLMGGPAPIGASLSLP